MGGSMLLKIAIFCSLLVTVMSLQKCCRYGRLYRNKVGKLKCVDIEGPSNINKEYVNLTLHPSHCPIIETHSKFENKNCQSGYNCKDVLYDVESKLALNVRIAFSSEAKTEWTPLTDVKSRTIVKRCCPLGHLHATDSQTNKCTGLHYKNVSVEMSLFSQIPEETFSESVQCDGANTGWIYPYDNTFIGEEFANSPLRDHPLVQYLQKEAEALNHCIQTGSSLGYVLSMCSHDINTYEILISTLETIENQFEIKNEIFACSETNEFKGNYNKNNYLHNKKDASFSSVQNLVNERIMFASPLELEPLNQLISGLNEDHQRITATIIHIGEKSHYWSKHEWKFQCARGIRPFKNVTITTSGELYLNEESRTLSGEKFCLSSAEERDIYLNGYVCEGFTGEDENDTNDSSSANGLIITAVWISIAIFFGI